MLCHLGSTWSIVLVTRTETATPLLVCVGGHACVYYNVRGKTCETTLVRKTRLEGKSDSKLQLKTEMEMPGEEKHIQKRQAEKQH